jgi:type VI secretion system secreted protein VgrG
VKHDRTESVGHDETITIGIDRSERGNNNEKIPIGANRTDTVGEKKPSSLTPSAQSSPSPGDRDRALATHAVGIDEAVWVDATRRGDHRRVSGGDDSAYESVKVGAKQTIEMQGDITAIKLFSFLAVIYLLKMPYGNYVIQLFPYF